jgi:4-amino-4-deoxyprephenate dehydrogenase
VSGAPTIGRVVVAGGSGAVGSLFAERLQDAGNDVVIVDLAGPGPARRGTRFVRSDVRDPDAELTDLIRAADAVLLSVPEPVALVAIGRLAGALRPDALIADTLSVKTTVVPALRAAAVVAGDEAEALSLNPMFAPSLGFAGHPVASVVVRDGRRGRALHDLIEQWGARVVTVTADQHDRVAAAAQVLTHAAVIAFGAALAELDIDIADLDRMAPPPHTALLSLLARIASGAPEVYWDVQAANPHAPAARGALARGVSELTGVVEDGDRAAFGDLLDRLRGVLGPLQGAYRERSARGLRAMTADLTKETLT